MNKINLAIVGATGMVGRTFLEVIEERNLPFENLYLFSSKKSAGQKIDFMGKEYEVIELTKEAFDDIKIDIALFSAGGSVSEEFAPFLAEKGVLVIDNSSAFRMTENVPLVVPEVNPEMILKHNGIIANPNCSTIQAVVAIKPLHDKYKVKRIVYSTYQAVSGSGVKGVSDLEEGWKGNEQYRAYPHSIAKNVIPHIDVFYDNGYTKEELKMIEETKKILGDYSLRITATTVRVPILYSHSESINLEFEKPYNIDDIFDIYSNTEGIVLEDNPIDNLYPLPERAAGRDEVFVGRIRRDFSLDSGLNLWVVADNIRKGAATNAVQIAEYAIKNIFGR